ncbi:MAG TPA: AAA family ATPase [Patescibacteria group bacterium]|jgi:shikimate kinase|nr:AAA family ATPase [Patescibacteria group bacterium]
MKQLHVSTPHCLIVTGLPGSGKTKFARAFADTFGAPFFDTPAVRSFVSEDFPADDLVNELISQFMRTKATLVIETGAGSRIERQELVKHAKANGYTPLVVWVQTDPSIARRRATVSTREHAAVYDDASFDRTARKFTPPNETEPTCVISGMHTQASQLRVVLKRITHATGRDRVTITPLERSIESASSSRRLVQ